ncbi:hypothetical protein [Nocardioides dongxiaopingii]|uniref:hypothetical protein n=1 Tax=Nocardioides dongxiaopingii TaxID=2576036 RepID=UPI0010C76F99|nr:hypothetical protein [Nocardioides dongxiaopingii]
MRPSRLLPSALLVIAVCASLLATPAGAAPVTSARAGYAPIVSWEGGVAMACRAPLAGGRTSVRVYWDGRGYRGGELKRTGSAGLGRVSSSFAISDYTYSVGKPGKVGPVAGLTMADSAYVYLLVGSGVGITREVVVPVRSLDSCGSGRAASNPAATNRAATGPRADRPRACVTRKELKKVTRGLQPAAVQRVVGAGGRVVTSASESLTRRYPKCSGGRAVVVNFQKAGPRKPAKVVSRFW